MRASRIAVAAVILAAAACGDSTAPTIGTSTLSSSDALRSLSTGLSSMASSSSLSLQLDELGGTSWLNGLQVGSATVSIDGVQTQMYAVAQRVVYPAGTCLEQLLGVTIARLELRRATVTIVHAAVWRVQSHPLADDVGERSAGKNADRDCGHRRDELRPVEHATPADDVPAHRHLRRLDELIRAVFNRDAEHARYHALDHVQRAAPAFRQDVVVQPRLVQHFRQHHARADLHDADRCKSHRGDTESEHSWDRTDGDCHATADASDVALTYGSTSRFTSPR